MKKLPDNDNNNKMIKFDLMFMGIAHSISKQSYSKRRQVGSVIVKDGNILSFGYNGTVSGFDNNTEMADGTTNHAHTLHAESNAIAKLAKSTQSSEGSTVYTTCSPCIDCAKLIVQAGISRVVFDELYRDVSGIDLLLTAEIDVYQVIDGDVVEWELKDHSVYKELEKDTFEIEFTPAVKEFFRTAKNGILPSYVNIITKDLETFTYIYNFKWGKHFYIDGAPYHTLINFNDIKTLYKMI